MIDSLVKQYTLRSSDSTVSAHDSILKMPSYVEYKNNLGKDMEEKPVAVVVQEEKLEVP